MTGIICEYDNKGNQLPIGKPLTAQSTNINIGASSTRTGAALSTTVNNAYRVVASDSCYVNIGDATVTASATNMLVVAGQEYFWIINKDEYVSVIALNSYDTGVLSMTPLARS